MNSQPQACSPICQVSSKFDTLWSLLAVSACCCRYYDVEIDDDQDYSRDDRNGKRWQDGNGRDTSRYTADQRAQGMLRPKRWSPDSGGNVDWD